MNRSIILFLFITAGHCTFARSSAKTPVSCSYGDTIRISALTVNDMLAEIMGITGLQSNFELKQANVLNIEASISHRKRYILYNPDFLNKINNSGADKWSCIALLAHEIGHHLNGHTIRKRGSKPALELEADEFAGFILNRLGASLEQAQSVMFYIAKVKGSSTHPGRIARLQAIEKGWNRAGRL